MENLMETFKQLGFTEYESKAYISLVSLVSARADEISKQSGVPRSKVYSVLENLYDKGLIEKHQGRPIKYSIINPKDTLPEYREKFNKDYDILEKEMITLYESKIPKVHTPITSIEDVKKISNQKFSLIKNTQKSLCLRIGFIIPSEIPTFKKQLTFLMRKGVKIKVLASKDFIYKNKKIDLEEELSDLALPIKFMSIPEAQLFIRDNKEMLLVFAESLNNGISEKNMIALHNTYSTIISNYLNAFNKHFN